MDFLNKIIKTILIVLFKSAKFENNQLIFSLKQEDFKMMLEIIGNEEEGNEVLIKIIKAFDERAKADAETVSE